MKVTIRNMDDRLSPWCVTHYVNRRARRRFFRTRYEAGRYAADLRQLIRSGGSVTDVKRALQKIAGTGYTLAELVTAGLAAQQGASATGNTTFKDGADAVIAAAVRKGCRAYTLHKYKGQYDYLNRLFGARLARTITAAEVGKFLGELPNRIGTSGKASAYTKETYLRGIRMALCAAGVMHPLQKLHVDAPRERVIPYFPVDEVKKMLGAAQANERGALALALFAAIRPERMHEIPQENVNVTDRTLTIPANVAKTHRGTVLHTIESGEWGPYEWPGLPSILWEWLSRYPFVHVPWKTVQRRIRAAVGHWIHDGCRHTAATYYKALYGFRSAAELLTHTGCRTALLSYIGTATKTEAARFFKIHPDDVSAPPLVYAACAKVTLSPEDLAKLVRSKPITHIAAMLKCSDVAVHRRCKRLGIMTPGRGAWTPRVESACKSPGD